MNQDGGGGTHAALGDVVRVPHDVTSQAKVADLDQLALTDEHVPGCPVSVDALGSEGMGAETVGQLWGKASRSRLYEKYMAGQV